MRTKTIFQTTFAAWAATFLIALAEIALAADSKTDSTSPDSKAKVILQSADGSVKMLAREATIHGTTVRYEPQPHKNTIGYWTKLEDWVSWDFQLDRPGTFEIELTQACAKSSAGSEYSLTIGDFTLRDIVPDTGTFTNFVQRIVGQVTLGKPGMHTVAVKPITKPGLAVMDLRAIMLRPKKKSD